MSRSTGVLFGIVVILLLAAILAVQPGVLPFNLSRPAPAMAKAQTQSFERSITVVGEGKVSTRPTVAKAQVGVETLAPTVEQATEENSKKMSAILARLKSLGVEERDIQTSNYSINLERSGPRPDDMNGYRVSNMVQVTIRNLANVGSILDQVVAAGANNVWGVQFTLDDTAALQSQARAAAMADAQARADDLARLSNAKRGEVLSISEVIGAQPVFRGVAEATLAKGGGGPVSPGELEVQVQIQVTYAIE